MSEFWKRKLRTYFNLIDRNRDGRATREDFEHIADRFGTDVDEERQVVQRLSMMELYNIYESTAGSEGHITVQGFIEAVHKLRDNPEFLVMAGELSSLLFFFLDHDQDKNISVPEFVRFFRNFGTLDPEREAVDALDDVDTDRDGNVSRTEMRDAFVGFITSEDESLPGSKLFGKLAD